MAWIVLTKGKSKLLSCCNSWKFYGKSLYKVKARNFFYIKIMFHIQKNAFTHIFGFRQGSKNAMQTSIESIAIPDNKESLLRLLKIEEVIVFKEGLVTVFLELIQS